MQALKQAPSCFDRAVPEELVYLGVGSNLGDRKENILDAALQISNVFSNFKRSSIYETAPMYRENQPDFLNCVFCGICDSSPFDLLKIIQEIENNAGRHRGKAGWMGPRPIDLDILLFGMRAVKTVELVIPHPGMKERPFVLFPLIELDRNLTDPETGVKFADYAAKL